MSSVSLSERRDQAERYLTQLFIDARRGDLRSHPATEARSAVVYLEELLAVGAEPEHTPRGRSA